jgi:hypothetical protein
MGGWVWVHGRWQVLAPVLPYKSSMQRTAILSSAASLAPQYFSTISHKRHDFRETVTGYKTCILIFSTTFIQNVSHSKN